MAGRSLCLPFSTNATKALKALLKAILTAALLSPLSLTTASLRGWTDSQCLATALHYEARGEPLAGRRAVLDIITNRMLATGQSACSVVLQRGQFSWSKKKPLLKYDSDQKAKLGEVVRYPRVLGNNSYKHFYSGPKPSWARGMICKRIYNQNFCKGK